MSRVALLHPSRARCRREAHGAARLLSDGPTTGFRVKAIDDASERGEPPQLSLSLDKPSGKNGACGRGSRVGARIQR